MAQKIIESTSDAIMVTDLNHNVIDVNPAYTGVTGYTEEEVKGKPPHFIRPGKHPEEFFDEMWKEVLTSGSWSGEIWDPHKDGRFYPKLLTINTVYDDKGSPLVYTGIFSDISSLKEAEERLHRIAYYDPLTGLPNRSMFLEHLSREIAAYHRSGSEFALLFIDLDKFKNINDTLGHAAGDKLLQEAAGRIRSRLRELDTVARLGGDEFTVILVDTKNEQTIAQVATSLIEILREPFYIAGSEVYIGASIGIALCSRDGDSIEELTKFADMAMYHAKNSGRDRFSFFTERLNNEVQKNIRLERELRDALARNEFLLYYQPKVSLATHRITGVEALIRWNHPERGLILPSEFIPVAEENGLILPIGEWVIQTAIEKLSEWDKTKFRKFSMSVNLSSRQFCEKDFVQKILGLTRSGGASTTKLVFEITESMLMEDPARSVLIMKEMKKNGISLAVDDFGTGYSSLSYLRQFPLDTLKIDQSFVRDILVDPDDAVIVKTIILMAKSLGLEVVAEGVETREQQDFLASRKCQEGQGFLFAKPLSEDEINRALAAHC
jgi:diguanylate cyclase (GGDEF)-like protein/PAS domain S-box-containing protein